MNRTLIRRWCVYLLIALLPLQAAAIGKLATCADMASSSQKTVTSMDHCEQMSHMTREDSAAHTSKMTNCWLGSICLAQVVVFAVPMTSSSATIERTTPVYPSVITHYRSVILDDPQRPPVIL